MKRISVLVICFFAILNQNNSLLSMQSGARGFGSRIPGVRPRTPTGISGTFTPTPAESALSSPSRTPLIGRVQETPSQKLTVDLIPATGDFDEDIKKLKQVALYTKDINFAGVTLEKQTNASYWIALAYLQQVGSANQWLQDLNEEAESEQTEELDDIISFNYANTQIEKMSGEKRELYLSALIKAIDYVLNPNAQDWRDFLNNTMAIQIQRPIPLGGIRLSDSLRSALNGIKQDYPRLQTSSNALQQELQEIINKKPITTTPIQQRPTQLTPQTGALVPYVDVTKPRPAPGIRPTQGVYEEYAEPSPTRAGTRPSQQVTQPYAVNITTAMPINIIPLASNKAQIPQHLEQLRELRLDSGNISMSVVDLQKKEDANYWLALAFLQRVASAYAQWKSNKLSEQEKSQFKDIADFGYWFSVTEEFDDAWLWQAIIDAIFYIQHPNNQGWNAFLSGNKINLSEGLTQNLRNIRSKFDVTLNNYKTYAAILASAAQNNVYQFAEQFLQAMINLKLQGTSGKKVANEELEKSRDIFASLFEEVNKNKTLEAELTKAKWELRNANIGFDRYLDRKNIKEDLQSNKILLDKVVKPKEPRKEVRAVEERKQPGVIPVPVPVPIKGRREQEQVVAELQKPVAKPVEQPVPTVPVQPQPVTVAQAEPQPQPTSLAPTEQPVPQPEVAPESLPSPTLPISPEVLESAPPGSREWIRQGTLYQRDLRRAKTSQEMQELMTKLQDKKELYPDLFERAQAKLADLQQEKTAEEQRAQGMQLVPYTGPVKFGTPETKEPRYTLAPGAQELIEGRKEEQVIPEWQQKMIEDQQRKLNEQLNEQLRQQLLEQLQQEGQIQPTVETPSVTILPPSTPVTPIPEPLPIPVAPPMPTKVVKPAPARPVTRPTAFAAAAELGRPSAPVSVAAQTAMVVTPISPTQPVIPVQPPTVEIGPITPSVQVPATIVPRIEQKPVVEENVIAMLEKEVKRMNEMALPAIRENSKDKDTIELAKVFLNQALESFELYSKYQPQMRKQDVLIELRDYIIFFKQLKQAYLRALSTTSPEIASSYFEAIEVAEAGEEKGRLFGWMKGATIADKEQEKLLKELKIRFASALKELTIFVPIFKTASRDDRLLKATWEFINSLAVTINIMRGNDVSADDKQEAIKVLTHLLSIVNPQSDMYNETIEIELNDARKALLNGFKRIGSDKYNYYLGIIHPSSTVYDDIVRALEKLDVKPLTRVEQEKYELTRLIKTNDPRAIVKLQEIEQLPADDKREMKQSLEHITPANQEKLANIYTQAIEQKAQAGDIAQAQQLVQEAARILPAQQQAIITKVQPVIASAQRKEAELISAQTAQIISAPETVQGPTLVQPTITQPAAPASITPEEKEFLKQKELPLHDQNIYRVIDIFTRSTKLNDEEAIRLASFAMKRLMDQLNKLKAAELKQLDPLLVEKLRALWEEQVQEMVNAYLALGEQAIALTLRSRRLKELEERMDEAPTTQELHDMIPELQMMISLGQKNKVAQALSTRAQTLYDRVERRLKAFTRWVDPASKA